MKDASKGLLSLARQHAGIGAALLIVVALLSVGIVAHWEWVAGDEATTLRNVTLVAAAALALPLAVWRSHIAHKQARATQEQVSAAQGQVATAQDQVAAAQQQAQAAEDGLKHDRYQKGADMLGSASPATRLGGIYALERLGREFPDEYHVQIMKLLGAFVRYADEAPNRSTGEAEPPSTRDRCHPDAEAAMQTIGGRNDRQVEVEGLFMEETRRVHEIEARSVVDLSGAHLRKARLTNSRLHGATLDATDLTDAYLGHADMEGCLLRFADLSGAMLLGASLKGAKASQATFAEATLTGADISNSWLTDADLTKACLANAKLIRSRICNSCLKGADLNSANLTKADLSGTCLDNADLGLAVLTGARLKGADLKNANLRFADLRQASLTGADLSNADLTGADLATAVLQGADLAGARLDNAKLCGAVGLTQAALDSARKTTAKAPDLKDTIPQGDRPLVWKPTSPS